MVSLEEKYPECLKKWNYKENDKLGIMPGNVSYGSHKKVYWVCDNNHTWLAPIARVTVEKRNCPYCTNQKVLKGFNDLETKYPELLKEWDYKKNIILPDEVVFGSKKRVWWICSECGNEWITSIVHRTGKRKTGCPECAKKKYRQTQLKNQILKEGSFADNYPELLKEWDYEENVNIDPYKLVSKSSKKVHWICKYGHKWSAIIASRVRGTGCPICAGKVVLKGFNDLATKYPELAKEWDYDKNNSINLYPDSVVCHSEKKANWICPSCGNKYKAAICHRVNGTACPECADEMKTSFGEQTIYYYLSKIFNADNRWNLIGTEADIFLNDFNIAIEYDGELYHSSKTALEREKNKYNELSNLSIHLIRVKENFKNKKLDSYADYTIELKKKNYDIELERVINDILDYINDIWNLDYKLDVNIKRDRQDIYAQYIKQKKENSVAVLYPDKIKDWDYSKNKIKPDNITPGSFKRIWWKCSKGHSYDSTLANHIKHKSGCPYCSNKKVLKGYNDLLTTHPYLATEWNYEKNTLKPDEIVAGSNKKIWWKCNNCGNEWISTPNDRSRRGSKCPKCHNRY